MVPGKNRKQYSKLKQVAARIYVVVLGLFFALLSSFTVLPDGNSYTLFSDQHLPVGASDALEKTAGYQSGSEQNNELHLSVRSKSRARSVRQSLPKLASEDAAALAKEPGKTPETGFVAVGRPAYYVFLFRYTLF